ncbi:MAG TPA: hypothetical protein VH206_07455 [Xanthobacteraceae bacterium]|jgi:hypothetical protein|nr:hypothetical protein [Xanthobacteraceae bacterium]
MRSAGNFSPDWGYLAPAPSLMRTARVVVVATAIGATAGAGVVLSLIDHPTVEAEKTPFAARAIVTSAQAAPVVAVTPAVPAPIVAVTVPNIAPQAAAPANVIVASPAPAPAAQVEAPVKSSMIAPPPAVANTPADNAAASAQSSEPHPAEGVAALSDMPPVADKPTVDVPNLAIAAPEPAGPPAPPKKKYATPKSQNFGTMLQRLFSSNANRQSIH